MLNKKNILWSVAAVAIAVRGVFAALFAGTMFRYYHQVQGLDMMTLLRFSEWGVSDVPPFFTLHRFLIYIIWKLNNHIHLPDLIFLFQTASGAAAATALADLALMLTGKRKTSLLCGFFYALYLPFLIYEFSILQETFAVNLLLLAIWSTFKMRKMRFALPVSIASGALWALASIGRPTAILLTAAALIGVFCYAGRKRAARKTIAFYLAFAAIIGAVWIFNSMHQWKCGPFYNVLPYTIEYNTAKAAKSAADAAAGSVQRNRIVTTVMQAAKRVPQLYAVKELPENQNIYFWRLKLPDLTLLPGPELLLSLTVFGMVILLFAAKLRSKEALLWYPLLLLSLPLCAREALGRYRLLLCPYFIIISCSAFYLLLRIKPQAKRIAAGAIAAGAMVGAIFLGTPENHTIRANDYLSWATACEARLGQCDETLDAFLDVWKFTNFNSELAFCALQRQALLCKRHDVALTVIKQAQLSTEISPSVIWYFTGLIFVARNDAAGVQQAFSHIKPAELPKQLQSHFHSIRNETERIIREQQKRRLNNTR